MVHERLDLALRGGVDPHVVFTDRGLRAGAHAPDSRGEDGALDEPSRPGPYLAANLGSHVGDDPRQVAANRRDLGLHLGVAAQNLVFMRPDHGNGVAMVDRGTGVDPGAEIRDVDALVTDRPGVALVALAADCAPIVLASSSAVAAVHSGWRGLAVDVVGAAVHSLSRFGPGPITAVIGPAICGRCYAVPRERADEVAALHPAALSTAWDGQPAIDLRAGLVARLGALGIPTTLVGGCTFEDERLFSHRREVGGRGAAATGRQCGAIVIGAR